MSTWRIFLLSGTALALLLGSAPAEASPGQGAIELADAPAEAPAKLENNVAIAKAAAKVLLELADKKPPNELSAEQKEGWAKQSAFFAKGAGQLNALAAKGDALLAKAKSQKSLVSEMAAMNMRFLALQEATQAESRKFQTLSTASRARHDIAMNAIRNIKA